MEDAEEAEDTERLAAKLKKTQAKKFAEEMAALVRGADVIVVSGGNPLYAVARWQALGVDALRQSLFRAPSFGNFAPRLALAHARPISG